jgi:septum formation protein
MVQTLFLASASISRRSLLTEAGIPFTVIEQRSLEQLPTPIISLDCAVAAIAVDKMEHAQLPVGEENQIIFVLTADTLVQDSQGVIHGKPRDYQEALLKIKALQGNLYTTTGFCLERKRYNRGTWHTDRRITQAVGSLCQFTVPDGWIESYLSKIKHYNVLSLAGGLYIEHFGMQFLKSVQGSYSTILGLPMFEVRQSLETLGFFNR